MTRETPPRKEPFGQTAVRKGYVTQQQVSDALARQREITAGGAPHKLIGMVMLEMGILGTTELIEILREVDTSRHREHP